MDYLEVMKGDDALARVAPTPNYVETAGGRRSRTSPCSCRACVRHRGHRKAWQAYASPASGSAVS